MAKSKATTGKAKAKAAANPSSSSSANQYGILLGMDGNPRTPAEFDQTNHSDVEMYFNPSDEATDVSLYLLFLILIHRFAFIYFGMPTHGYFSRMQTESRPGCATFIFIIGSSSQTETIALRVAKPSFNDKEG